MKDKRSYFQVTLKYIPLKELKRKKRFSEYWKVTTCLHLDNPYKENVRLAMCPLKTLYILYCYQYCYHKSYHTQLSHTSRALK